VAPKTNKENNPKIFKFPQNAGNGLISTGFSFAAAEEAFSNKKCYFLSIPLELYTIFIINVHK